MKQAILIYGATAMGAPEFSADLLWRTGGYSVPDPVIFCEITGKKILLLSSLEIERGAREAKVDEVVSIEQYVEEAKRSSLPIAVLFLKERDIEEVIVAGDIRFSLGKVMSDHFKVTIKAPPFYPERAVKTDKEMRQIESAQRAVEKAVAEGMKFLKECLVKNDLLFHSEFPDTPIASHHVRKIIDDALYLQGYLGVESIVACGTEAADPHCKGYGNIKPKEPIVLDIFPRSMDSLYFSDQTRTVFKGEPNAKMKRMYNTVLGAQEMAIREVKSGVQGNIIDQKVRDFFDQSGYPTNIKKRPVFGFIHSLGHGVGIEIHEEPSLSQRESVLETGNVVTVEPGLYYPKETSAIPKGGIRIEDMVLVTDDGNRNLTKFPKSFEEMIIE